jgi:signal transduction histidine kinase
VIDVVTALLAGAVAAGYFTIAAIVVPRVHLEDATPRFARAFLVGGVAFFVGCGLTHLHIAVHALTDPDGAAVHEVVFHLLQVFGVWVFIWVAVRTIDVRVTRRRTPAEAAAQERAERLARSNADLERFANVVSHDLQEPLRTVSGFAELMQRRDGRPRDPRDEESLELIVDGCRRMAGLLDGVLDYSRAAGAGLELERVDLGAVVDDVLAGLDRRVTERGAVVDVGPLPEVEGDRVQLTQLVQNLLTNALKHGGDPPRVRVWADAGQDVWRVHVGDEGPGVRPEDAERVFAMFQQAGGRRGGPDGRGMGLAIARRIAERHGGRLWVSQAPVRGSVFTFTLPAVLPEPADLAGEAGDAAPAGAY